MQKADVMLLFDYNYWANRRVLDAAANVSDEQFVAPANQSHGSLRGTLVHVLHAEWVWRLRTQEGIHPTVLFTEEEFPNLGALRSRWEMEEEAVRAYLGSQPDGPLDEVIEYTTTSGVPHSQPLWQIMIHVVNHGTQFRSEAALLLTEDGHSPGDLDFIQFLRLMA